MTPRESGVVACLIDGMSYKTAGVAMGLSEDAVEHAALMLRRRLRARSNVQMVAMLLTDDQLGPLSQHSPPDVVEVLERRRQMLADRDQCCNCGRSGHLAKDCKWRADDSRARLGAA